MLYSTVAQAGFVAMAVVCAFAFVFGDKWARLAAALYGVNWILVYALQDFRPGHFHTADLIADFVALPLALALVFATGRMWAATFTAFRVINLTHYVVPLLDHRVTVRTAITASYLCEIGALASLVWSVIDGRRRARLETPRRSRLGNAGG